MKRTSTTEAIVLKTSPFGELHRSVTLFTPEHGILYATAYGALKPTGKLRSVAAPFTRGTVYLYRDPSKDATKITEIDAYAYHEGIRGNLRKFYVASLWAEMIMLSHGGGEGAEPLYCLFADALENLDRFEEEREISAISVQFAWRYLDIQGVRPDPSFCGECGRSSNDGETVYVSMKDSAFLCDRCRRGDELPVQAGLRKYLEFTATRPLSDAVRVLLGREQESLAKNLVFRFVEEVCERPLNTLRTGEGIL